MTKMFGNLRKDEQMETPTDRVGGGFQPLPSGVYDGVIKMAYVGKSQSSDAQNVTLHVDINGREVRETIYITNRQAQNFYVDKDTKKEVPLPGYTLINDICLLTTGQSLVEQDGEEKIVKIYNFTEKKEIPTTVPVLTGLLGTKIKLGILREIVDKNAKDAGGNYNPTGETRTQNKIDKAFHHETGRIVNEYRREIQTADFLELWTKTNDGNDKISAKHAGTGSAAGASGSGRPDTAGNAPAPSKSLFG